MNVLLPLALLLAPAAQDDLLEGHSRHGEAFNEGPRQAAYLLDNPASVHFPVTVANGELQRYFDQGVGHLHGFWYFEAERTFRQVAAEDPDCAMAYWGMAMATVTNRERATGFARVAWLKRGLVDVRERMYIDALASFYGVGSPEEPEEDPEDESDEAPDESAESAESDESAAVDEDEYDGGEDDDEDRPRTRAEKDAAKKEAEADQKQWKVRAQQLVRDYEEIVWEYPEDIEAKAFLVNQLWMNSMGGLPITSRHANEALLQQVFAVQPDHPAHHYRIHLWDEQDSAARVVDSAVASGPSWPTIAHMWHMGGHIFARLGRHSDAAWQQEASARVDHAHMIRDHVLPDQIHNFAHNNEWLTRSLRHHGRVSEAVALAMNMIEMPRHPRYNRLDKRGCSASWGRIRLLETLELYERWDELVRLAETMYLEPSDAATDGALRAFALGKAHAFRGDERGFEDQVAALEAMLATSKQDRADAIDTAEERALELEFSPQDVHGVMDDVLTDHAGTLGDLRDKLAALHALAGVLAGDDVAANLEVLKERRFEKAHLARLFLDAGRAVDDDELALAAVELAREAIEEREGQLLPYATLAWVLWETGARDEALEVFDELRAWTARADLELPVFERLAPLVAARGLPADWRAEPAVPDDVDRRIDLATLGPEHWAPPPAADWTLPDAYGGEVALADYRGRPVLVIFFLGFGCVHCVEQLQVFGPAFDAFEAAGIDVVAIGTNTVDELRASLGDEPADTGFPFPLLADPGFEVFRRYRAYDDFEDMPLHGTFLVDGDGRVRWRDVSYEPFMEDEFLLDEGRRLLGLPGSVGAQAAGEAPDSSRTGAASGLK